MMNDRKQHVIKMAHQLFIKKGFQATSIQDILDYSSISKGTFYNYFSSKNELLMAIFTEIQKNLEKERNAMFLGQDPSDIELFIKQMILQVKTNRVNRLLPLYEEVLFLNDIELKKFIKDIQLNQLHWVFTRFCDIFDQAKQPYLLDGAIMFISILHQNLKYDKMTNGLNGSPERVIRYSVNRAVYVINEIALSEELLFPPELLEDWFPSCNKKDKSNQGKLRGVISSLERELSNDSEAEKYIELLDFIQEELLEQKKIRRFLIESALSTLEEYFGEKKLQSLVAIVNVLKQKES